MNNYDITTHSAALYRQRMTQETVHILAIVDFPQLAEQLNFLVKLRWPLASLVIQQQIDPALHYVSEDSLDLVMLKTPQCCSLVPEIRRISDVPIILLINEDNFMSGIKGLEMGADEYITCPINELEFLARIKALLRRTSGQNPNAARIMSSNGILVIDESAHEVTLNNIILHLTPTEYALLLCLVQNEGRVISHSKLRELLWDKDDFCDPSSLKKYISRLRRKLHDNPQNPSMVRTVRGIGYKFVSEPHTLPVS